MYALKRWSEEALDYIYIQFSKCYGKKDYKEELVNWWSTMNASAKGRTIMSWRRKRKYTFPQKSREKNMKEIWAHFHKSSTFLFWNYNRIWIGVIEM